MGRGARGTPKTGFTGGGWGRRSPGCEGRRAGARPAAGGMAGEDARLALQRPATSKIGTATDLIGVATLGFGGEALPAIASVSRFERETCGDGEAATHIRVPGEKIDSEVESARQRGTTVTVRGLFYNTPPRRKFL